MKTKPNAFAASVGHLTTNGPLLGSAPGRGLAAMQKANRNPVTKSNRDKAFAKPIESPMDHLWGIE